MEIKVRWRLPDILLVIFLTFAGIPLLGLGVRYGFSYLNWSSPAVPYRGLIAFLLQDGLMLLVLYLVALRKYKEKISAFFNKPISLETAIVYGFIGLVVSYALSTLTMFFLNRAGVRFDQQQNTELIDQLFGKNTVGFVSAFFITVVFVPIVEEVFFRGFLFQGLKGYISVTAAAIITSACFAAAHLSLALFLPIFVIGLVLSYLMEKTDSILPGIFLHAFKNLGALLVYFMFF